MCEKERVAFESLESTADNNDMDNAESRFLLAVQQMMKESQTFAKHEAEHSSLLQRFCAWRAGVEADVAEIAKASVEETKKIMADMKFVDTKPILADLTEATQMDKVAHMEGWAVFMNVVKTLQGSDGGGLKRYDNVVAVMKCFGRETVEGIASFDHFKDEEILKKKKKIDFFVFHHFCRLCSGWQAPLHGFCL